MAVSISERIDNYAAAGIIEGLVLGAPGVVVTTVTESPIAAAITCASLVVAGLSAAVHLLNEEIERRQDRNNS